MANPYDPKENQDNHDQGIGTPSSDPNAPSFKQPDYLSAARGGHAYSSDPDVAKQEMEASTPAIEEDTPNSAKAAEQDALNSQPDDKLGLGYTDDNAKSAGKKNDPYNRLINKIPLKRRAAIAGTVIGVITAGGVGAGIMGPAVLGMLHLQNWSEMLQSISAQTDIHNERKTSKLFRALTSKDMGRTRLGILQNKSQPKFFERLKAAGYTLTADGLVGQMKFMHIEPSKIPALRGRSAAQIKAVLADRYGVPTNNVKGTSNKMHLLLKDVPIRSQELILKDIAHSQGTGKLVTFLNMRLLRRYFNVPSLFHPFERLDSALERKFRSYVERNKAIESINLKINNKIIARIDAALARLGEFRLKYKTQLAVTGVASAGLGVLCTIRDGAANVDAIQREYYMVPAMISAASAIAQGDQTKQDIDTSSLAIEAASANLYDKEGRAVFDGKAAAAVQGKTSSPKIDDTGEYNKAHAQMQQVFSGNSGAAKVMNYINQNLAGDILCSKGAQAADMLVGIGLMITGGGGIISKLGGAAVSAVLVNTTFSVVTSLIAGEPPKLTPNQGPSGGDLSVYGAAQTVNSLSAGSGGSQYTEVQVSLLAQEIAYEQSSDFKQKNFFERLFDPTDYRTPAGQIANSISPDASRNLSSGVAALAGIGESVAKLPLRVFGSVAHAQTNTTAQQRLGMPTIADQPAILAIEDPYENANKAADLLDADSAAYINRAKICYGVDIAKATDPETGKTYWDVTNAVVVDTSTPEYADANCGDVATTVGTSSPGTVVASAKNESVFQKIKKSLFKPFSQKAYAQSSTTYKLTNWGVVTGLVSYGTAMESLACGLANDETACEKIGLGNSVAQYAPATGSTVDTTAAIGPAQFKGAQDPWGGYAADQGGRFTKEQLPDKISLKGACTTGYEYSVNKQADMYARLHPYAVASVMKLNELYRQKFGHDLLFKDCYRSYDAQVVARKEWCAKGQCGKAAEPGKSNHGWGLTVDFRPDPTNPNRQMTYASEEYKWLMENAPKVGWVNPPSMQQGGSNEESWHWEYARALP